MSTDNCIMFYLISDIAVYFDAFTGLTTSLYAV